MADKKVPSKHFNELNRRFPNVFEAHENLGSELRQAGPLDEKTLHLIQLGAAGANGAEGAVHSHTRRAMAAGASEEEIYHALLALMSTIGFPQVMAALCWARDIIEE